jgi:hypothetical protein
MQSFPEYVRSENVASKLFILISIRITWDGGVPFARLVDPV